MSELLSSLASVITVAASATDSIKVLVIFFRRFRNAPEQVHQWLTMLESLRSTLASLQQCGRNLDPRYQFSPHFQQRLLSCVIQLQICASEIPKIDAELLNASPDGRNGWEQKARKSWQRAKWALVRNHKIKKTMELMSLYHFEFAMELLKALINMEHTVLSPSNLPVVPRFTPLLQQVPAIPEHQPEVPPRRLLQTASNLNLHHLESIQTMPAATPHSKSPPTVVEFNFLDPASAPATPVIWSHQSIKPVVSFYWNILAFRCIIRAYPLIKYQSEHFRKNESQRYQQIGFSLIVSIYLPQRFRHTLGLALCHFQMMVSNRTRNSLHWSLGFPTTVSPNAEIFASARAGSIGKIKCLLSLGKASAKDTTIFGMTLLHSASKSGNLELVRLLIQEGADVNAQDEDGESSLHAAMARGDNYNVARTLIENGADLSSRAVDGKTPFHTIFNNTIGQVLMRDGWLENMQPDSEAMSISHYLAWSSRSTPEIFQRGLAYDDVDIFSADAYGRTCLHLAASRGNLGVLSYLVQKVSPSSDNVEQRDNQGRTPIHYAAESSRAAAVIDMLVGRGCNIHAVDDTGRTALHWAARWNNVTAVRKLIAIVGWRKLLVCDANRRTSSQEVCQRKAPALYEYLRGLESSSGLRPEQSKITRRGRRLASHDDAGLGSSTVLNIAGIAALIFIMLLGTPD